MFAQGLRVFAVMPDLVTPETRTQVRPALPDHIGPEHPRVTVEVPYLDLEAPGKVLDRRPQELHAAGNLTVAGKGVVLAAKGSEARAASTDGISGPDTTPSKLTPLKRPYDSRL